MPTHVRQLLLMRLVMRTRRTVSPSTLRKPLSYQAKVMPMRVQGLMRIQGLMRMLMVLMLNLWLPLGVIRPMGMTKPVCVLCTGQLCMKHRSVSRGSSLTFPAVKCLSELVLSVWVAYIFWIQSLEWLLKGSKKCSTLQSLMSLV